MIWLIGILTPVACLWLMIVYALFKGPSKHQKCLLNISRLEAQLFPDLPEEIRWVPGKRYPRVSPGGYGYSQIHKNPMSPASLIAWRDYEERRIPGTPLDISGRPIEVIPIEKAKGRHHPAPPLRVPLRDSLYTPQGRSATPADGGA